MPQSNRLVQALKENFNLVGLASAFTLSAVMANPLPFIAGLVMEAAYLLFVPDSKWYERRLAKRFDGEILERRQQLKDQTLPTLRASVRGRFQRLETRRSQIETFTAQDERWFREILRKLDYLLEKFLLFASKEKDFRRHLENLSAEVGTVEASPRVEKYRDKRKSNNVRNIELDAPEMDLEEMPRTDIDTMVARVQKSYEREMERIRATLEEEKDENTRLVMERRLEILQRRTEFVATIGKILTNLDHQMRLVEDTFGLINDEIRARSPEQLTSDIDEVILASNSMTTALEEITSMEQMVAHIGA